MAFLNRFFLIVFGWFHSAPTPEAKQEFAVVPDEPVSQLAPDVPPPTAPPPLRRRAKWARPMSRPKKTDQETAPAPRPDRVRKPKIARPAPRPDDDPEQWGQYYFRDAILDQLGNYFVAKAIKDEGYTGNVAEAVIL